MKTNKIKTSDIRGNEKNNKMQTKTITRSKNENK